MIAPPLLKKGSLIRLISPAGAVDSSLVKGAAQYLSGQGFRVKTGNSATSRAGRFAGTDQQRLDDLQEALSDPECGAILCNRGGYGSIRILDKIRWEKFIEHPKWLIGYSDITLIHAAIQKCGFQSIHGGMARLLAEERDTFPESTEALLKILTSGKAQYHAPHHPLNKPGKTSGVLAGGNLSILYSLRGTPYDQIPEQSILFIEDIGEKPYAVDRMMHNLKLGGVLSRISGLIVGTFSDYEEDPSFGKTLYELIAEAVSEYSYPVCFGFPVGHEGLNLPVICGANAQLSVSGTLTELAF